MNYPLIIWAVVVFYGAYWAPRILCGMFCALLCFIVFRFIMFFCVFVVVGYPPNFMIVLVSSNSLQWRHNECDGVSNHRHLDCVLNRLSRCRSRKHQSPASQAFVKGIRQWPVNSLHKGPVTRNMFPFDDVIIDPEMDKHISWIQ